MAVIYLDNGDTSRIDDEVFAYMTHFYKESYGNPASLHQLGMEADENLSLARNGLAKLINCSPAELLFTSGATEANNWVINGLAKQNPEKKHLLISSIEHSSIKESAQRLAKEGFTVEKIRVDHEGFLDLEDLKAKLRPDTLLVSVIYANYEIGTIQNIAQIADLCHQQGALFHTDAAQAFGRLPLDVAREQIDLMTINCHKIHGPKGVGALYVKKGILLGKLFDGGAHEFGLRAGTENLPAIMGFYKAGEIAYRDLEKNCAQMSTLRDRLAAGLMEIDHVTYNGPKGATLAHRLCNNVDITFQYIEGEAIMLHLSLRGICVSSGSACSSKTLEPSHVLTAIGLKHEQAHGSIRFTLSKHTTVEEVDAVIQNLKEVVQILRSMTAFIPSEHSELESDHAKTFYKSRTEE